MAIRPHGKGEVENTTASKGLISLGAFGRMPGAVSRQQATLGFTQQWALCFFGWSVSAPWTAARAWKRARVE